MRFRTADGYEVAGRSYAEVCEQMQHSKLTEVGDNKNYRSAMARRIKQVYDIDIDVSSPKTFILALVDLGMLERVK